MPPVRRPRAARLAALAPALLAALAAVAGAQEPDPRLYAPPSADRSPTSFACTVETLLTGAACVFEGQAPPAADAGKQAEENGRTAAALGNRACARASKLASEARADEAVLAACHREFAQSAAGCAAEGSAPLLDAEGRFGAGARPCYAAMAGVLAKARLMAAATGACCRCLASGGCAPGGERCNRGLASGALGPTTCMAARCGDVCRAFLPVESPPAAALAREPAAPSAERGEALRR
jgi:hypothetical protein